MDKSTVPVLLGTTIFDKLIMSIQPAIRKIVLARITPVPFLTVHEARIVAENNKSDDCQDIEEALAILVVCTVGYLKNITAFRPVETKAMYEKTMVDSTKAVSLMEVNPMRTSPK